MSNQSCVGAQTKIQAHARLYIAGHYTGLNLPWSATWEVIGGQLANNKLRELPEPERSLAYVAVGFYALVRGGDL